MQKEKLEKLKQMLASKNDDDKNLAGCIISTQYPELTSILNIFMDCGLTINNMNAILNSSYSKEDPLSSWRMTFLDFGVGITDITRTGELKHDTDGNK